MTNDYEMMRAEIKRLHNVCRAKDKILQDAIDAINIVLNKKVLNESDTAVLNTIVKVLQDTIL